MRCHERRRASGVDRQRWAFEVEEVCNAGGPDRITVARARNHAATLTEQVNVLVAHQAEIDAALGASEAAAVVAGVLECAVRLLKEEPVLRVHFLRFSR